LDSASIVLFIKHQLGHPKILLEVDDTIIQSFINQSVVKIAPHYTRTSLLELPVVENKYVNLTGTGVLDVTRVFEKPMSGFLSEPVTFGFPVYLPIKDEFSLTDYAIRAYRRAELESLMVKSFRIVGTNLLLDNYYGTSVVIECMKTITSLSDMASDETAISWVTSYALALTKIAIGLIRRKFTPSNAPYQMDGDALVNEGTTEKQTLEEQLTQGAAGFFMVLR